MALKLLNSKYGKVHRFTNNPRFISDGAFTTLVESVQRDTKFMQARGIVIWEVPENIKDTHPKSPFCNQAGKLIVIGGNQRYLALLQSNYDRIPDDFIILAKDKRDDKWWTPEEAERFLLLDNNPEGISGETDYQRLVDEFNREAMRMVGIDYSNTPLEFQEEESAPVEEEVEKDENGEKDPVLDKFIKDREASRQVVPEMMDCMFYSINFFDTAEHMAIFAEFLKNKFGIVQDGQIIDGYELAEALGCHIEKTDLHFRDPKPEKALQELSLSGVSEGWEEVGDGMEEGTETVEDEEKGQIGDTDGGI